MTKLKDVLKVLKAEADEAQKGVDRWQEAVHKRIGKIAEFNED